MLFMSGICVVASFANILHINGLEYINPGVLNLFQRPYKNRAFHRLFDRYVTFGG